MIVGVLQIALRLPEAHSLKEKRRVLKSLTTRLRNRFNVSISEVDSQDAWQSALLAVAYVGADRGHGNRLLDQVLRFAERERQIEVVDSKLEFL